MKTRTLAIAFALTALPATLLAQQPDMPSMPSMPSAPAPQQKPTPNRTPDRPDPAAPDMRGMRHDAADRQARAAGVSEQQSVQQQAGQAQGRPGAASDATSLQVPIQDMQEPEALDIHTGADLPAPELLGDVVTKPSMTLEQFLALADGSNPTLAQAQRNIDRSRQQARQAGLPPDPTLGYSGDHIRGGSYHGGEQGAFVSQEFVLGGKLALRRKALAAEGRGNEYALQSQRARVHNDVAQAFFNALAAQASVTVHDRLLKVALDTDTNTHELARVGQADAAAILTAEVAAEQARIDFLGAQRMFLAAFAQLATAAGQHALAPHPLTGSLAAPPELDPQTLAAQDTASSPLVQYAQANVEAAQAHLLDARRERVPNLNVTAGEWYSGEPLGAATAKAGWESFAQAGVQLPLWNHNQGNIGAAQAILARSREDLRRTQLWTENQTEPLVQQYLTARFTAGRYRTEMLPRARRAYQLQVTKYQQMALAYPEVLAAQRLLFTLQLGYIDALDQQWRTAIALQNFALSGGLEEPLSIGSDDTMTNRPTD